MSAPNPAAALPAKWQPMSTAPTDGTLIVVKTDSREGLPAFYSECAYHPDAGFCVDELREPIAWTYPPALQAEDAARQAQIIARERAYAFQWCLEHNQGDLGRRADCRECQSRQDRMREMAAEWGTDYDALIAAACRNIEPFAPTGDRALRDRFVELQREVLAQLDGAVECIGDAQANYKVVRRKLSAFLKALPALPVAAETPTVLDEVRAERHRQDAKWGGPAHDDTHNIFEWWGFMKRRMVIRAYPGGSADDRTAMIQIAALAVAAVESMDRKVPAPPAAPSAPKGEQ